jgi:tRNA pseudouridine55 synthase
MAALAPFQGEVMQRPPSYSAKKRGGERAYAAARAGRPLDLDPVMVRIHELRVVHFALPDVVLDIRCGSGTYIRAIARDLGEALGVGGHLTSLRRTGIGDFAVDGALTLQELPDPLRVRSAFVSPAAALAGFPHMSLDDDQVRDVRHGRAVRIGAACAAAPELVLTDGAGNLVAIGSCDAGVVRPRKVFA